MDYSLLQKSVDFHGNQLIEALRAEQGDNFCSNLSAAGVQSSPESFGSCSLSIDRKRTLVSFIAQKADILFKRHCPDAPSLRPDLEDQDYYAVLPPLECYTEVADDARKKHFYETLAKGDVVIGSVSAKHTRGLIIELLCVSVGKMRCIHDLVIKCFCNTHQIPPLSAHEDPLEPYHSGDLVQGVVLDVQPDMEKIYISFKEATLFPHLPHQLKLGLISDDDLPIHYEKSLRSSNKKYEEALESTLGFMNPSVVSHLSNMMGIDLKRSESLMRGLHAKEYCKDDYASEIYKVQCSKWAYKSVKQGVHHFKAGNTVEAFQCLNKALQIDPQNVEALVARGALYANNNSFSRAIDDFNKALEFNPHHVNAGKFAVETLVAFGKQHEEQSSTEEAIKCYQKALLLNPNHSEAMYYMKSSQKKAAKQEKEKARQLTHDAEADSRKPAVNEKQRVSGTKKKLQQLLNMEKDEKYVHKRRRHSSPSPTLSSSSTRTSASESSSTSSRSERTKGRQRPTSASSGSSFSSSSRSSSARSRERDSRSRTHSRRRSSSTKSTSDRASQKSKSKKPSGRHGDARRKNWRPSGNSRGKRKEKRPRRTPRQKKRSRTSESDSSTSTEKDRRKSNSSSGSRSTSRHVALENHKGKADSSKTAAKTVGRQDSKCPPEDLQPVLVDPNSHPKEPLPPWDGNQLPPKGQEKEQRKAETGSGRQSLEELESFLACLKASKNTGGQPSWKVTK